MPERNRQGPQNRGPFSAEPPTRNRFDLAAGEAVVSAIFDWYREDFETEERTLADYIAQYVDSPDVADVLRDGRLELHFARYDWGPNGRALRCD